jgi:Sec7-like guanine-nucleotide exchange factor
MKFLERDELASYSFQNDFLKPFVVVMRQTQNVEIRELIIRCVSQVCRTVRRTTPPSQSVRRTSARCT